MQNVALILLKNYRFHKRLIAFIKNPGLMFEKWKTSTNSDWSRLLFFFHWNFTYAFFLVISYELHKVLNFQKELFLDVLQKNVLKNFTKFAGKQLWKHLHLMACNFAKKRHQHRCFSVNFGKSFRTPFLQNIFGRSLLNLLNKTSGFLNRSF